MNEFRRFASLALREAVPHLPTLALASLLGLCYCQKALGEERDKVMRDKVMRALHPGIGPAQKRDPEKPRNGLRLNSFTVSSA